MKWKKIGVLLGTLVLTAAIGTSVNAYEFTDEKAEVRDEYASQMVVVCWCGKVIGAPYMKSIDHTEHLVESIQQTGVIENPHGGSATAHGYGALHYSADSYDESATEIPAIEEDYLEEEVDEKAEAASFVDSNGLTWEVENGVLTISGSGVIEPLWLKEAGFFVIQKAEATSLVIEEGITEIGDKAFTDFWNLQSVDIPNSVTKIGDSAFEWCKKLTEIDIPDSVTEIGESAFERSGLTSISLPSGLNEIKKGTFWHCKSLAEVAIPDGVTKIGEEAFSGCQMSEITIPNSVTEIGNGAFLYCDKLNRITIPSGVKIIHGLAFGCCTNLAELTISNGVTEIGPAAFYACGMSEVTIPDSVKRIGYSAFASCLEVKSFTFEGDAPQIIESAYVRNPDYDDDYEIHILEGTPLENVYTTVYYPAGNQTYTEEVKAAYGSVLKGWEENKAVDMQLPFVDVDSGSWFLEPVEYVYKHGIMTGMDTNHFGPSVEVSRAQVASILHRLEGEPTVGYDPSAFKDVADGMFYTKPAMWAKETGVIAGYADGNFGPADYITREQLSVILFRYAQYKGFDTTATDNLSKFPDKNKVSGFAKEGISWAVGTGLITGDQGKISPQGYAERAQAAAIFQRFMTKYGE